MSYILEALKKLEQKREHEDASRLPTFSSEEAQERKKPLIWPYILVAALLVNAGLALRLFGPWWTHEQEPSSIPVSPSEPPQAPPERIEKEAPSPVPPAKIVAKEPARPREAKISRTPARQKEKPAAETPTFGQKEAPETASLPAAHKAQAIPQEAPKEVLIRVEKAPSPAFAGKVVSPGELPPSVRASLPEFRISGHAYAPDPQTRVVRINEKILQEGQELSPGLRVEEIVPDGIIMSYSGYHIHIGVKDSH